jgi:mannitol-1-/sugar-/sorbitol-6-phosphatase
MARITCKAVLFDLDGVLIDSTPAVTRVWSRWAIARGFDPVDLVRKAHGRPSIETIRDFLPHADHAMENCEVERCEMEDLEGVLTLPGARKLLAALPPDRWTLVTSCTRALAEVRLRAAGLPAPHHLVTADDIKRGKPDPEPYLKGASLLGVLPRDCVVVEDVPAGIRAGKAAGARVIALRTTTSDQELNNAGADWIVNSCKSITAPYTDATEHNLTLTLDLKASKTK